MYVQKVFLFQKGTYILKFLIYVQNLEIFRGECTYKNFQCVYVSCNHDMMTSFFYVKKNNYFLCYFISYSFKKIFIWPCLSIFQ